ncbi:Holliday junction DNA helicase subunit RuvA [Synechococcus sp. PCC 7502]|uniref:Holliday junction branch migration protein RuvA n=1 Tax=Synechococcus sp. PCC 7502 TaxID=1173263 RepID=UPI00029FD401|nr:Holliday junction branch migration protein RuvA [Synechococcus sp. PCC 7502]AFY73430.1 Holliday junction DNA helicase subunit RuvA [Synechococcus sp. PCC 7502]
MIGYLRGTLVEIKTGDLKKSIPTITLDIQGIGYEVQVTANSLSKLPAIDESLKLYTYLQVREDRLGLFGFLSISERDLFRELIAVSGIGTQMAIALINTLGIEDLVKAIVTSNTRILSLTPGVGTKTAERIALELKSKLADWRLSQVGTASTFIVAVQEDLEMTLLALGYSPKEINQALGAIATSPLLINNQDLETWLKVAINWLSQNSC